MCGIDMPLVVRASARSGKVKSELFGIVTGVLQNGYQRGRVANGLREGYQARSDRIIDTPPEVL